MNNYINIILIIIFLSIVILGMLGITFAVLKSNNDEYIKTKRQSEPNFTNNNSEIYLGLSITFFILFFLLTIWFIFFYFNKKPKNEYRTPLMSPIMRYDTSTETTPNSQETTPYGISSNQTYMRNIDIPKFPNLE